MKTWQLVPKNGVCYREVSAIKHVRYREVSLQLTGSNAQKYYLNKKACHFSPFCKGIVLWVTEEIFVSKRKVIVAHVMDVVFLHPLYDLYEILYTYYQQGRLPEYSRCSRCCIRISQTLSLSCNLYSTIIQRKKFLKFVSYMYIYTFPVF